MGFEGEYYLYIGLSYGGEEGCRLVWGVVWE